MIDPKRPVTVDTGGPDDLFVGALVTWWHKPRAGYGFHVAVPGTVERVTKRGVTIRVANARGTRFWKRVVAPASLRWGQA